MEGTQKDQVTIVTGATGSMGAVAAHTLAAQGRHVVLACRNTVRAEELKADILHSSPSARVTVAQLNLAERDSIRQFAQQMGSYQIADIFCNAGIKTHRYTENEEGIEMDFAVNYLGNRRLTLALLPLMAPGAHIVFMLSLTARLTRVGLDWCQREAKDFGQLRTYARSKRALLYYAIGLAQRNPHLHIHVADPGVVNTDMITMGRWYDRLADILFRPFISSPARGVRSALHALQGDGTLRYYVGRGSSPLRPSEVSSPLVEQFWRQAEDYDL